MIGDRVRWGDTQSITIFVMKFEMFKYAKLCNRGRRSFGLFIKVLELPQI